MVQYSTPVDRAFAALADPTRRAVVERLGSGSATISELAEPVGISLTGMKMDVRAGGAWRFRTPHGVVAGEFREVVPPERIVQTFQNHLQTLEFEDLGERTKLTQTMRFETTEDRDTTMSYGVAQGAEGGFARIDALLARQAAG